jgi:hypothetical protein
MTRGMNASSDSAAANAVQSPKLTATMTRIKANRDTCVLYICVLPRVDFAVQATVGDPAEANCLMPADISWTDPVVPGAEPGMLEFAVSMNERSAK